MNPLTKEEKNQILKDIEFRERSSDLGYFSKPFRVNFNGRPLFIKLYFPVKDQKLITSIMENHEEYIRELKLAGLKIPETTILSRPSGNKHQLIIIQDAFRDEEMLRNRIIRGSQEDVERLCHMVFDEMLQFLGKKSSQKEIGFHPTLRNYSVHEDVLWFFDTFPPMVMSQRELNSLVLKMSPYGGVLKKIIPLRFINRVTDEYYNTDKMFTGIVGSCCRLRPDDADKILTFSREYVNNSALISTGDKEKILQLLKKPPQLSGIWILIRKLSGNKGNPNINIPISV